MKKIFTLFSLLLLVAAAHSQMRYLKASLQSSQEVPPTASAATGIAIVKYNTTTHFLELAGDYQGLTAAVTMSHIHGSAPVGVNAPVLFDLVNTGGTTGTLKGSATLSAQQEADLLAGLMYVNVHTATYPNGEIRGQLTVTTDGQTNYFDGRLQGAQQVPPNGSTGAGGVIAIVDAATDSVWLTGNFTGLTAAANAAHIHNNGAPGVNGPVFLNLVFSAATAGTLHVAAPITDANQTQMINGTTYVNIHNTPFPEGEIRAQLTMLSKMRFLKATLDNLQEVPPTTSAGRGTAIIKYNTQTRFLELIGDYQNLTSTINNSHIHSFAPPGTNAPVLINLTNTGGTSGTLIGSATLTMAQEADLLNGLMYVNVHTINNPGGEIRGQITATTGQGEYLTGTLQAVQEVPSTPSTATGKVAALLDKGTNRVYVTGDYTGLSAPASAGHIHRGQAGVNGSIVVDLRVTAATAGTITGNGLVSAGFADSMIKGFTYVNIHNATYPGGEIRAQLGDLVLPLKLNFFNGYKKGNDVVLQWETFQEVNLRHFEIEQQDATGAWIKKGIATAVGGSNTTKYNYNDQPLASKNEYVLYRLKMVDADGKFTYSPVVRINYAQSKADLTIMANPVTNGALQFTITGLSNEQRASILIADYNGRIVLRTSASTLQNNRLDVSKLAAGMYKLMVNTNGTTLQESFTKY